MGNFTSRKYWTRPRVHEQYANYCSKCKYLFLSPYYQQLTCPVCIQLDQKPSRLLQSNKSGNFESKLDSLISKDKVSQ